MPNTGLPSPASTPMLMLENNYRQTQAWLDKREQELQSMELSSDKFAEGIDKLQVDYDTRMDDIETNMNTVRQTQHWIDIGIINETMGAKLKWGAVVPKEALDMMFPEPDTGITRRPLTPDQMVDYRTIIKDRVNKAEEVDVPGFWDRPTHATMLKQYKVWQTEVGYAGFQAHVQRQLDQEWDIWAEKESKASWNPAANEVRALRAKGPISRSFSARFRGTPTGPREAGDPLKDNIIANLSKKKEFLARMPTVGMGPAKTEAQPEPVQLSDKDKEAISWARQNPDDPRAVKILILHGAQ